MAAQQAEGIILRKYFLRETSYILIVFTKEFGKIKGVIKGVRNPVPQFGGNFEIFSRARLLFYKKKKSLMDLITQCETVDFFLPLRKSLERLTYASYFVELVDIVTVDYEVNEPLYKTLVDSLALMAAGSSAKRVSRIFELKLLEHLGLSPVLDACVKCKREAEEAAYFSIKEGGILCLRCVSGKNEFNMPISLGAVKFMRKIRSSDISKLSGVKVSGEVGRQTEEILRRFLQYHIARPIKTLTFMNKLKNAGVS